MIGGTGWHLYTAIEAERFLGIPSATVRSWHRRERIYPQGLDERRRPMFAREDLLALRDRSRTREQDAQAKRRARNRVAHRGLRGRP